MNTLADILSPEDLHLAQAHFSWDISRVACDWVVAPSGGFRAQTSTNLLTGRSKVRLNTFHIPSTPQRIAILHKHEDRRTILHELIHCDQSRRGLWYRLKRAYWNRRYSHEDQPDEQEAHSVADIWAEEDAKQNNGPNP